MILSLDVSKTGLLTVDNLCVTTRCDTGFLSERLQLTLRPVRWLWEMRISRKPHQILTELAGQLIWKSTTMLIYANLCVDTQPAEAGH